MIFISESLFFPRVELYLRIYLVTFRRTYPGTRYTQVPRSRSTSSTSCRSGQRPPLEQSPQPNRSRLRSDSPSPTSQRRFGSASPSFCRPTIASLNNRSRPRFPSTLGTYTMKVDSRAPTTLRPRAKSFDGCLMG